MKGRSGLSRQKEIAICMYIVADGGRWINQHSNKDVRILSLGLHCPDSPCSHHSAGRLAFTVLKALVGIRPGHVTDERWVSP